MKFAPVEGYPEVMSMVKFPMGVVGFDDVV
jgi:hypothetical protein